METTPLFDATCKTDRGAVLSHAPHVSSRRLQVLRSDCRGRATAATAGVDRERQREAQRQPQTFGGPGRAKYGNVNAQIGMDGGETNNHGTGCDGQASKTKKGIVPISRDPISICECSRNVSRQSSYIICVSQGLIDYMYPTSVSPQ
jgi:hypothetical protein